MERGPRQVPARATLPLCGWSFVMLIFALWGCVGQTKTVPAAMVVDEGPARVTLSAQSVESLQQDSPENLNDFISLALKQSSELEGAYKQYLAAQQRITRVSTLPDPKLNFDYFIDSIETRVGPQRYKVGIAQPFPWFGKLSLRGAIADQKAKAAYYSFLAKKNVIVHSVISTYFELAYVVEAAKIAKGDMEILRRWQEVLAQRYRTQAGTQSDLIKVQIELGKLEDKVKELHDLKLSLTAHLNSLLNRPVTQSVVIGEGVLSAPPIYAPKMFVQEEVSARMKSDNPELQLLQALIKAEEEGEELARKDFYPDLNLGVDYIGIGEREEAGYESGDDAVVAKLSMTLPIYQHKYDAGVTEALMNRVSAQRMFENKQYVLESELAQALFSLKDSERRVHLFRDTLIPKGEESLETTYTSFEAKNASFLDLLETERDLLDFKLSLARAMADTHIAASKVGSIVGKYNELENGDPLGS